MGLLPPKSPHPPDLQTMFKVGRKETGKPVSPFSLGFPGENWNEELSYLIIPIPTTEKVVLVGAASDYRTYTVVTKERWDTVDSALMASALVHEVIERYLRR